MTVKDTPWAHCIYSISPNIRNYNLIWENLSTEVLIVNGETPFIDGWFTFLPNWVLKGEMVGLMTAISSISWMTEHRLSMPWLSQDWEYISLWQGEEESPLSMWWVPLRKAKNWNLFRVAWCYQCNHVYNRHGCTDTTPWRRCQEWHHHRKPFEGKGIVASEWVCIPLNVLLAVPFR